MKKALMLASVASMIDKFNMDNIEILKNMNYSVDVVSNFEFGSITSQERVDEFKDELIDNHIKPYHVPIPRKITDIKNMISSYKTVKALCNSNKYELIHCHSPIGGVIARLATRKIRKKGTKVIYTAHGFHFCKGASLINWLLYFPIEWLCSWFTDCLITINKEDYQTAKKHMHAKSIKYVPGIGIDTQLIGGQIIDAEKKRKEIGIDKNSILLMSVGELNKNKNHLAIIEALSGIDDKNVHYILIGIGALKSRLLNMVKALGLDERVHFMDYRYDVFELLKCADIFCFPSYREGLPVSLMEAMSAGLPIVCSKTRGNTDLIEDGVGGFLCEPNDVEGFRKKIKKLIENKELREEMSKRNKENICKFDIKNVKKEMAEIYHRLLIK